MHPSSTSGRGAALWAAPRILLVALAASAAVGIAGCGGGSGRVPATASTGGHGSEVVIEGFTFGPASLTVAPGTRVTWSNEDSTNHTATAEGGSFDTGTIKPGSMSSVTLAEPGTYDYVCQFHPFMKGAIRVR